MIINRRQLTMSGAAAALAACARAAPARAAPPADAIGIVAAPNPHTFPLLLAMSLNAALPVRLLPIPESRDADALFASGEADAMLAMTYIGAKKRMTGAIPDLRLYAISTWRGFFQVAAEGVTNFGDLRGQTVIVSGPVGSGQGGGGDVIFQAAARRQGVDPATDLLVQYMPVAQGVERVWAGEAAAITLPSPGSTGLVMRARMAQNPIAGAIMRARGAQSGGPGVRLSAAIDFQRVFSGFAAFPEGQLPLGGLHVCERALAQADKRAKLDEIARAYADAAARLMSQPSRHAGAISSAFQTHFAATGAGNPPAMVISRAVELGDLIYRSDVQLDTVRGDLSAWLRELLGRDIDAAFFEGARG